jgi:antitoxin (DNA-binding transcriptional repressor) of toxin-antitoxin stability system
MMTMVTTMDTLLREHGMKTVAKGELKAKMLEYFREVERTGEELIVLDNREPVLRVSPIKKRRTAAEVFGPHRGRLRHHGDLTEPTTEEWSEV